MQREYRQRSPTGPTVLGDTQAPARQDILEMLRVIVTWELKELEPKYPPLSLTLPRTTEALALLIGLGREARGVQAGAPGRRVTTEERRLDPSQPPATRNA